MNIQTTDAFGVFTKTLVAVYKERTVVQDFLSTFFPTGPSDITDSLEISVLVQRTKEKIASDVERGSDGNRNTFEKSTEKIFISPYFREYFDQTAMQSYEQLFRGSNVSTKAFSRLINNLADHSMELQNKIERRYELQRAQALLTGIITMDVNPGQLTFTRKASSFNNQSGAPWDQGAVIIKNQLQDGCEWLRKTGKVNTFTFDLIGGGRAVRAIMNNVIILQAQNLFNYAPDMLTAPQKTQKGGVYHGTISCGPYRVNIWSYPDFYEDAAGVMQPYITESSAILLPPNPNFKMVYAAVPQLLNPGEAPKTGKFMLSEFTDEKKKTREFHIESAGMPLLVAVDQVYTFTSVV
jgi:hypothetical protein